MQLSFNPRAREERELYRAQGFQDSYVIDRGHDGRVFAKYQQVRFVGNSVSPPPMAAILAANYRIVANDNKVAQEETAKKKAG